MTNLQVYSGLDTIGGNILEVSTEQARVICDFGLGIGDAFEDQLGLTELECHLLAGRLPKINGIFDTAQFQCVDLMDYTQESKEVGIIISHLHVDHMGGLKYLPEHIRVYMSEWSYTLYRQLIKLNDEPPVVCQLQPVAYNKPIQTGDITVTLHPSDHDIQGGASIWINTQNTKVIHSGDFRLHGYTPKKVLSWAETARDWEPDYLFIEGTMFSAGIDEETTPIKNEAPLPLTSEEDLLIQLTQLNDSRLIVMNLYPRNLERIVHIHRTAKQMDRQLVVEPAIAQLLAVFYPEESVTVLSDSVIEQIREHPSQYILQNTYEQLALLNTFGDGLYLHSNGAPLGDYDPNYKTMIELVKEMGFEFRRFAVSGHASQHDLVKIAKLVDAKKTVVWHTFNPDYMAEVLSAHEIDTFKPECGKRYLIGKGVFE